jgi:hypothetical protein
MRPGGRNPCGWVVTGNLQNDLYKGPPTIGVGRVDKVNGGAPEDFAQGSPWNTIGDPACHNGSQWLTSWCSVLAKLPTLRGFILVRTGRTE